jgi:hypothetical protein
MGLFPNEDSLTKEIESWKGFANSLGSEQERKVYSNRYSFCR